MEKRKYYLHLINNEYRLINYIIFKNTRAMINIFGVDNSQESRHKIR